MKVFVTGANGFVGSATVQELIKAGHQVLGLAHHDKAVQTLTAMGAQAHKGSLEDLESLKKGVEAAEGVIHLGFVHDFARFAEVCEIDRKAIRAMGEALTGTKKPIVVTSGTALVSPGTLALETVIPKPSPAWPRDSEHVADELAAKGIQASVVRLSPSVHDNGDKGFVPMFINLAKEKGVSGYVGEGKNRWTGVHRLDAAVLFRLALEKGKAGARYHGAENEGVTFKEIATVIGHKLGVPVEAKPVEHFGFMGRFAGLDCPASSQLTREQLGWKPTHVSLLEDMEKGTYFKS